MALGNNNYQNNRNNNQNSLDANYYSRLRINNANDGLSLTFTFWRGLLKINIVESNNSQANVPNNELASIYLSPMKARLMSECITRVMNDPETLEIYGINTGIGEVNGFMAIGRDAGNPYIVIAKVSKDGYDSTQRFNFNVDYNYLLQVNDLTNLKFKKEFDNNVELQAFKDIIDDYARAVSGAYGASFYDIGRYENAKTTNLIRKMAESVGVETGNNNGGYNRQGGNGSSYFNNGNNASSSQSNNHNNYSNSSSTKSTSKPNVISSLEDEFDV